MSAAEPTLLRVPYPYRAMLAICSDLDETPDRHTYLETMRFLNSTRTTALGQGVGLEVGNTIYFDMPPGQFAYWNTDERGRALVRTLIQSGHIDCLHSFGDLATTRAHAGRALDELDRHGCRLRVWIDHSRAPSNFGADIMQGQGDVPGAPPYHADLTCGFGVRHVWRGRITSVTGQDVPARLGGMLDRRHLAASGRTLAKEAAKHLLARCGSRKYALHAGNRAVRPARLRDGRPVMEFLRCNPHWGGVSSCDTAAGLADVLTHDFLDRLVERGGVCILYTHLGKVRDPLVPLELPTRAALRRLAERFHHQQILVTTTARLLDYLTVRDHVEWSVVKHGGRRAVRIEAMNDPVRGRRGPSPTELAGLSFSLPACGDEPHEITAVELPDGQALPARGVLCRERIVVSIPYPRLEFPECAA